MVLVVEKAKAKLNLFLHITGKRQDGYHKLESLVTFCDFHDLITIKPAEEFIFSCDGPFSSHIDVKNNLCISAAKLMSSEYVQPLNAHIHLEKNIPVAAGLGGGSSDAAAVIRALKTFWKIKSIDNLSKEFLSLGADVPVCLKQESVMMRGIGENISPVTIPNFYMVLVNPIKACPTKNVFAGFDLDFSKPMNIDNVQSSYIDFVTFLKSTNNQLEPAAIKNIPEIKVIQDEILQQKECGFVQMSGSGATCFGLFQNKKDAEKAVQNLSVIFPHYWIVATKTSLA